MIATGTAFTDGLHVVEGVWRCSRYSVHCSEANGCLMMHQGCYSGTSDVKLVAHLPGADRTWPCFKWFPQRSPAWGGHRAAVWLFPWIPLFASYINYGKSCEYHQEDDRNVVKFLLQARSEPGDPTE